MAYIYICDDYKGYFLEENGPKSPYLEERRFEIAIFRPEVRSNTLPERIAGCQKNSIFLSDL
jgi:hypothetical protein